MEPVVAKMDQNPQASGRSQYEVRPRPEKSSRMGGDDPPGDLQYRSKERVPELKVKPIPKGEEQPMVEIKSDVDQSPQVHVKPKCTGPRGRLWLTSHLTNSSTVREMDPDGTLLTLKTRRDLGALAKRLAKVWSMNGSVSLVQSQDDLNGSFFLNKLLADSGPLTVALLTRSPRACPPALDPAIGWRIQGRGRFSSSVLNDHPSPWTMFIMQWLSILLPSFS